MKKVSIYAFLFFLILPTFVGGCKNEQSMSTTGKRAAVSELEKSEEKQEESILHKVIPWKMGWLAVGSHGSLAEIQSDGTGQLIQTGVTVDLNDIFYDGTSVWIAGDDGVLLKGTDTLSFQQIQTNTESDMTSCLVYADRVYLGSDDGILRYLDGSETVKACNMRYSGSIVEMAASEDYCVFVTDTGETGSSEDGNNWSVLSYPDYYGKEVVFQGLLYDGNSFWAYGRSDNGTELFYTSTGTVWGERDINYLEGNPADLSDMKILSMVSDGTQLYAWCEEGQLLTIPDCVKCNKCTEVSAVDGGCLGYNGGNLLMVADLSEMELLATELAKQYQISAETAYRKAQEGAVIIDVRDREEYEEKHIRGSVVIPLGELSEKLPNLYPDIGQTIIFYCTKGVRSQTAVEKAVQMGYVQVYSLGSIDNWDYDFE